MLTNGFHVIQQVLRGVVFGQPGRGGATRTALIEQDDAIPVRVEETAVIGFAAGTRAAMQYHDRNTERIAAGLDL